MNRNNEPRNAKVSRVLYFFDQPLIVEIRTKQGKRVLAIKRDPDEEPLQWFGAEIASDAFDRFLNGAETCADVLLRYRTSPWMTGFFFGAEGDEIFLLPLEGEPPLDWFPDDGAGLFAG